MTTVCFSLSLHHCSILPPLTNNNATQGSFLAKKSQVGLNCLFFSFSWESDKRRRKFQHFFFLDWNQSRTILASLPLFPLNHFQALHLCEEKEETEVPFSKRSVFSPTCCWLTKFSPQVQKVFWNIFRSLSSHKSASMSTKFKRPFMIPPSQSQKRPLNHESSQWSSPQFLPSFFPTVNIFVESLVSPIRSLKIYVKSHAHTALSSKFSMYSERRPLFESKPCWQLKRTERGGPEIQLCPLEGEGEEDKRRSKGGRDPLFSVPPYCTTKHRERIFKKAKAVKTQSYTFGRESCTINKKKFCTAWEKACTILGESVII